MWRTATNILPFSMKVITGDCYKVLITYWDNAFHVFRFAKIINNSSLILPLWYSLSRCHFLTSQPFFYHLSWSWSSSPFFIVPFSLFLLSLSLSRSLSFTFVLVRPSCPNSVVAQNQPWLLPTNQPTNQLQSPCTTSSTLPLLQVNDETHPPQSRPPPTCVTPNHVPTTTSSGNNASPGETNSNHPPFTLQLSLVSPTNSYTQIPTIPDLSAAFDPALLERRGLIRSSCFTRSRRFCYNHISVIIFGGLICLFLFNMGLYSYIFYLAHVEGHDFRWSAGHFVQLGHAFGASKQSLTRLICTATRNYIYYKYFLIWPHNLVHDCERGKPSAILGLAVLVWFSLNPLKVKARDDECL